jgi:molecular chaperone GrpE
MTNDRDVSDVDYEPEDEVGTVGAMKAKLEKLKGELEHAKAERQEYLDGWQRCKADSINTRKETEARASRSAETLREALVHDIIPALDSFDMATSSEAWSAVSDGFRSGMEQVQGQLLSALKNHSIERFGKVGEKIDHTMYEVVEELDDVPGESGTVARILRYGYRAGARILRPAQVYVKK